MSTTGQIRDALAARQQALVAATESLTDDQLVAPSYCRDWNIAQVLSHLGSASQIWGMYLEAGLAKGDPPDPAASSPIWERWNAMTPKEQRREALAAGAMFLEQVDAIRPAELASFQMELFGMDVDAARLLGMRLAESAIHSWDIAVMSDPAAAVAADAVDDMVDHLGDLARWSGKTDGGPMEVEIVTTDPIRFYRLSVSDSVTLTPSNAAPTTATLTMPAESLVRLVYGRLDPDHTPAAVSAEGVDLNTLRTTFPGF